MIMSPSRISLPVPCTVTVFVTPSGRVFATVENSLDVVLVEVGFTSLVAGFENASVEHIATNTPNSRSIISACNIVLIKPQLIRPPSALLADLFAVDD
jgi:hypothetical protein